MAFAAISFTSLGVGSQTGSLTAGVAGAVTFLVTGTVTGSGGGSTSCAPLVVNFSGGTPTGVTTAFSPTALTRSGTGTATSTLTINTTTATPAGSFAFTVTCTDTTLLTANGALTVNPPPTVTAISPNTGSTLGGTFVTITGTNFTGATSVTIGGTPATGVTVVNSTTITANTPAGTGGAKNVLVTTPIGSGTGTGLFSYVAPSTVTGISPNTGVMTGGTAVTITGTNFTGATAVYIGGTAATGVTVVNDTTITATTPAGTQGAKDVVVVTPYGTGTGASMFSYVPPPPSVTAVSPNSGVTAGSTSVTISGNYFTGATSVAIGGAAATGVTVLNDTSISAITPAGTAGAQNVVVTTPYGSGTGTGLYTYVATPAPTVTAISPNTGTTLGGTSVTITGTNFTGATSVTIGGNAATSVTVVNSSTITANAPSGNPGGVDVVVTTPYGSGTGTGLFTYVSPTYPVITSVTPNSGPIAGGTSITISGSRLADAYSVTIGGVAATSITVQNPNNITAVTPAGTAGAKDIVVVTPSGSGTGIGLFTYTAPAPVVTSISPNTGSMAGGTVVTITGSYFTGATSVTIGGAAATGITVVNDSTITATTPSGTTGPKNVVVTTPYGTGTGTGLFTYGTQPTVSSITPNSGPTTGGTSVTIGGGYFTGATSVTIGGSTVSSYTVVNSATITATTPTGTAGAKDVVVTTAYGTGTGSSLFTYVAPPPIVSAIAPNSGTTLGGTGVTITGSNFTGATSVTIGGTAATGITVVNSTTIAATTPAGTAGATNVVVTTPYGSGTGTGMYTYVPPPPSVTIITPNSGPTAGGTNVTLSGSSFTGATAVTIGGTAASGITVVNDATITAITPAGTLGAKNVVVTTPYGTGTGTGLYTYVATSAPAVTAISPNSGSRNGGTFVTITGTNFTGATAVTIGGSAATGVTVVNSTTITATTPSGSPGAKDVVVTTPYGTGTGAGLYTFLNVAAPTVTAISPNTGPIAGGTSVTITGTTFTGATAVTIGGNAVASFTVVNATTITAVTPAGTAGAKNVVVTTPAGSGTGTGLFSYYAPAPVVTAISPNTGSTLGGTFVTVTGTYFTAATSVTIGGAAATGITVVNDTTITATTPSGTTGPKNVVVTTPYGSGTGTGLFTYGTPPTVSSITPNSGSTSGGTFVTIGGGYFTGATAVTIGGSPASGVTVVNSTTITAFTPAGTAGVKNVVVTTPYGSGTGTGLYTYVGPPTVVSISPNSGTSDGGTAVTISGFGFTGATSVTIGGTAATGMTVVSATTITATTPPGTLGAKDVVVTTPYGSGTGTGLFTYTVSAPTVTAISPDKGPLGGGTFVTITGTSFVDVTSVTIGGVAATGITVMNSTTITATTPAGTAGSKNVVVTTLSGSGTGTGLFTYVGSPAVTAISPNNGSGDGGTFVTITGTNFVDVTAVTIGGVAATGITTVNATTITANTPAGSGTVDVVVTTSYGTGTGTGLFTFTNIVSSFNAFETAAGSTAITGYIYTRLAATGFSLDVVAIRNNAKMNSFSGNVKLELLANSTPGSNYGGTNTNCPNNATIVQTIASAAIGGGRSTVNFAAVADVYRDVRVRISYPTTAPTIVICSNDSFAIRPTGIALSAGDLDWDSAGIGRTLDNTAASGGNVHGAGHPFTLTVSPQPATAVSYDATAFSFTSGYPTCSLPASCTLGTLTLGSFSAAGSGLRRSNNVTYTEVGAFNLLLQDNDFAAIDAGDGTPATCSNTAPIGRYICSTGGIAIGRFVSAYFSVTTQNAPRLQAYCGSASAAFTYLGQKFRYASGFEPQALITARSAGGTITTNYNNAAGTWHLTKAMVTQTYGNLGSGSVDDSLAKLTDATMNFIVNSGAGPTGNGTASVTTSTDDRLLFTRNTSTPSAAFNAALQLTLGATDSSEAGPGGNPNSIFTTAGAVFNGSAGAGIPFVDPAGTLLTTPNNLGPMRYGLLDLDNAVGSEKLSGLNIPIQTQYWASNGFIKNVDDTCTVLKADKSSISFGNYKTGPASVPLDATNMNVTNNVTLTGAHVNVAGYLKVLKPNPVATGSVDLTIDLSVTSPGEDMSYLQGKWRGATTFTANPMARVSFGIYGSVPREVIFFRENF